jgi:hypothetical protein
MVSMVFDGCWSVSPVWNSDCVVFRCEFSYQVPYILLVDGGYTGVDSRRPCRLLCGSVRMFVDY